MREKSKPPGLARKTPTRRCLVKLNPEKKRARERCLIISQTDGLVNRSIGRTPSSVSAMSLAHLARAKYERPETTTNKQKKASHVNVFIGAAPALHEMTARAWELTVRNSASQLVSVRTAKLARVLSTITRTISSN